MLPKTILCEKMDFETRKNTKKSVDVYLKNVENEKWLIYAKKLSFQKIGRPTFSLKTLKKQGYRIIIVADSSHFTVVLHYL